MKVSFTNNEVIENGALILGQMGSIINIANTTFANTVQTNSLLMLIKSTLTLTNLTF
jgi:hypothetical protein